LSQPHIGSQLQKVFGLLVNSIESEASRWFNSFGLKAESSRCAFDTSPVYRLLPAGVFHNEQTHPSTSTNTLYLFRVPRIQFSCTSKQTTATIIPTLQQSTTGVVPKKKTLE